MYFFFEDTLLRSYEFLQPTYDKCENFTNSIKPVGGFVIVSVSMSMRKDITNDKKVYLYISTQFNTSLVWCLSFEWLLDGSGFFAVFSEEAVGSILAFFVVVSI